MAIVYLGPGGIDGLSGSTGRFVYKHYPNGKTVQCKKPKKSSVDPSESQLDNRSDFKKAVEYAKVAKEEAIYQKAARRTGRLAYHLAVADYRNRPVVDEIDVSDYRGASGDVITVMASDDRHVASVHVRLTDDAGAVLEEGEAVLHMGVRWLYTATVSVPPSSTVRVEATATDLPGGTHTAAVEIEVMGVAGARPILRAAAPPAEEDGKSRRKLQAPAVRRARRRGQHKLPSPELRQKEAADLDDPMPLTVEPARIEIVQKDEHDRNELVQPDEPEQIQLQAALDQPEHVGLESPLSENEGLRDPDHDLEDQLLSNLGDFRSEHARLALTLLLAERLLRTRAAEAAVKPMREQMPAAERRAEKRTGQRHDPVAAQARPEAATCPEHVPPGFGWDGLGDDRRATTHADQGLSRSDGPPDPGSESSRRDVGMVGFDSG